MSLRSYLKTKILEGVVKDSLDSIDRINKDEGKGYATTIMLLDIPSAKVISSCMRIDDVIAAGVLSIENVMKNRERLASTNAIYFIDGSKESIGRLVEDFEGEPMYASAYVYVSGSVEDVVMNTITNKKIVSFLRNFSELHLDFGTLADNVFSLNLPQSMRRLEMNSGEADNLEVLKEEVGIIADKLVSLCMAIGEKPAVRFSQVDKLVNGGASTYKKLKKIGKEFLEKMRDREQVVKKSSSSSSSSKDNERDQGVLVIMDRFDDVMAALQRDRTYEAVAHECCTIRGDKCTFTVEDEKKKTSKEYTIILDDNIDKIWKEVKHVDLYDASMHISKSFNTFKDSNKMSQYHSATRDGKNVSNKAMTAALADMSSFMSDNKMFDGHFSLKELELQYLNTPDQQAMFELQADLIHGEPKDVVVLDKSAKYNKLKTADQLQKILKSVNVSKTDKLRTLMMFCVSEGLSKSVLEKLVEAEKYSDDVREVFATLQDLVCDFHASGFKKQTMDKDRKKLSEERMVMNGFSTRVHFLPVATYIPRLYDYLGKCLDGELDEKLFPYVDAKPSKPYKAGRKATGRRSRRGKDKEEAKDDDESDLVEFKDPVCIFFVAGGVSNAEIREATLLAKEKGANVIIGGTSRLNAKQFIFDLCGFDEDGSISKAIKAEEQAKKPSSRQIEATNSSASGNKYAVQSMNIEGSSEPSEALSSCPSCVVM